MSEQSFTIITEIRGRHNLDKSFDFTHDLVAITTTQEHIELEYHEPNEVKGDDGNYRTVRKSFRFEFSYAEFDLIAKAIADARNVAQTLDITINHDKA